MRLSSEVHCGFLAFAFQQRREPYRDGVQSCCSLHPSRVYIISVNISLGKGHFADPVRMCFRSAVLIAPVCVYGAARCLVSEVCTHYEY